MCAVQAHQLRCAAAHLGGIEGCKGRRECNSAAVERHVAQGAVAIYSRHDGSTQRKRKGRLQGQEGHAAGHAGSPGEHRAVEQPGGADVDTGVDGLSASKGGCRRHGLPVAVGAPAHNRPVRAQRKGVRPAGRHLHDVGARQRRRLVERVVAPPHHRAVGAQRQAVRVTGGDSHRDGVDAGGWRATGPASPANK